MKIEKETVMSIFAMTVLGIGVAAVVLSGCSTGEVARPNAQRPFVVFSGLDRVHEPQLEEAATEVSAKTGALVFVSPACSFCDPNVVRVVKDGSNFSPWMEPPFKAGECAQLHLGDYFTTLSISTALQNYIIAP